MPTIKDERLKIWSQVGDAMANGDAPTARLRMQVLFANFQDNKKAVKEYNEFVKRLDDDAMKQMGLVAKGVEELNPLQKFITGGGQASNIEWWKTSELYFFMYRLATENDMFPMGMGRRLAGVTGEETEGETKEQ